MDILSVKDTKNPDYKLLHFKPVLDKDSKTAIIPESRPVAKAVLDEIPDGYTMTFKERAR